jgi:TolB-like protein/AraC-like DNA-binding protein
MNRPSSMDIQLTRKLNEIIIANLENENFGVKELAHAIGMSRFNLNRKLHFLCRKTINQYIREMRLQRAMEILKQESLTASEVAFKVGFSSPAYFSTCFSEHYGYPPGEAKKRSLINKEEYREGSFPEPAVLMQDSEKYRTMQVKSKNTGRRVFALVSFLIVFIIAAIYFFNFISDKRLKDQTKSIAVLPFINDSQDPENLYFINGVMEAILDNLSKIKDLEVHPRTSVEPYRNIKNKSVPQIARELGVNYIIEGSGQKIGDQVSLYIQLIEASSDKHLFSQRYNMKLEDIFNLQSEVALKVASEIKAAITFEEKELIKKTPTTNFAALNLFLQANDLHNIAESEGKREFDLKAERLYRKAIQLDSTYADPYASLGWVIFTRSIDSAFYLANKALHFDSKNPEAYILKGYVYYYRGQENEAEESFRQSIKYKPNNSAAFRSLGELYFYQGKCYSGIKSQLQAFHLENNSFQERNNLESFCWSLYSLGFYAEGKKYAEKQLELDNDSSKYYQGLATVDLDLGDYQSALKSSLKMYACNTEDLDNIYWLFYTYLYLRDFREADLLMQKYTEIVQRQGGKIMPDYLFGFTCLENGQKEEAAFHFEGIIKEMSKYIELNQPSLTCRAFLTLAKIYSVQGEKAKALECLQKVTECMGFMVIPIKDYKNCTMFDNIRNEPGFAEYLTKAQAKYMIEHERVEKLLLDEGILNTSL